MSSLRIGSNTPPSEPLGGYVDSLAKWIPGEVIAFYAAGIAAMRGTLEPLDGETEVLASQATPYAGWLLLGSIVLAAVLTIVGAIGGGPNNQPRPATRNDIGLVAILVALWVAAFTVWSLAIPESWWTGQGVLTVVATVAVAGFAIGFVPLAELAALLVKEMPEGLAVLRLEPEDPTPEEDIDAPQHDDDDGEPDDQSAH